MSRLRIVFLGTGNAFNTDGRGSQAIWIEPEGGPTLLVDAGPTALAAMERFGLSARDVCRLAFGPGEEFLSKIGQYNVFCCVMARFRLNFGHNYCISYVMAGIQEGAS